MQELFVQLALVALGDLRKHVTHIHESLIAELQLAEFLTPGHPLLTRESIKSKWDECG